MLKYLLAMLLLATPAGAQQALPSREHLCNCGWA
jgi:hypothetical protein